MSRPGPIRRALAPLLAVALVGCSPGELAPPEGSARPATRLAAGCAGSVFSTLQAAIDAAVDYDVIDVCAGTYAEHLVVTGKIITLHAVDGVVATTIDATGSGTGLSVISAGATLDGFTFVGGSSAGEGGNIACTDSVLDLADSVVSVGTAVDGGGLAANGCTGSVTGTTFADNSAAYGGGAWIAGGDLRFAGNTLTGNHADVAGGGLYLRADSAIADNTFDGNDSDAWGGGGYVLGGFGEVTGNRFEANTAIDDGGGIYLLGGAPYIAANTFLANVSDDEGGGLRLKLSTATVLDNVFTDNHADYRGGASKISHAAATLSGNTYERNSTWVTGGALLLFESASTLSGETFVDNTAENGGAIAIIDGWDPVLVEDGTFDGNEATREGGHVWVSLAGQSTTLLRCELTAGSADLGGGVYAIGSELTLENTLLRENVASVAGGGAYLDATSGDATNAVAWRNDAPDGAAIAIANGAALTVRNTVLRQNGSGAAISLASGLAPTVEYCDFSGNGAVTSGFANPVGTSGNLGASPGFVAPLRGNFHLRATSALVDAGDPAISDTDGSRSDQGIWGGPQAN